MQSCVFQVCPKENLNTQRFVAERLVIEGRLAESFVPESLVISYWKSRHRNAFDRSLIKRTLFFAQKDKEPIHKRQHERESVLHELNHSLQKKWQSGAMRRQICEKMLGKFRVTYSKKSLGTSLKTRSALGTHERAKFDGNFDNCGEPSHGFRRLAQPCWTGVLSGKHFTESRQKQVRIL